MKYRKTFSCLLLTITAILFIYWLKGHTAPQIFGEAIFSVKTQKKVVALTFDDGPIYPNTNKILDILNMQKVKATFFILGQNAENNLDILKKMYADGHELGNHSWSHEKLIFKTPKFIQNEIGQTDKLIRASGYTGTIHFRAPYGNKLIVLPWILKRMNRPHILFDITAKDWENPSPEEIVERITKQIHPGAIILLHDGIVKNETHENKSNENRNNTVEAVNILIHRLKESEYQFLTVSELLKMRE